MRLYSLPYSDTIIDEFAGGLAFLDDIKGLINFCWLRKMSLKRMKKIAKQQANELNREVVLVKHENQKLFIFKPEVEE